MTESSKIYQELLEENQTLKQKIKDLERSVALHRRPEGKVGGNETRFKAQNQDHPLPVLHQETEAKLWEKSEELDRYFTTALDLFCIADTDGYFRRLNRQWEFTLGYSVDELEGRRFLDFVHPDDVESTLQAVARLGNQGQVLNFINRYRHKSGSYRWIEWRSYPSGKLIHAAARDITERKQAEEGLQESEEKYRVLFNNPLAAISIFDLETHRFLDVNEAHIRLYGYSREELLGEMNIFSLSAEHEASIRSIQRADKQGALSVPLRWHRKKDGTLFPVEIVGGPYLWKGRRTMFAMVFDITERISAEQALKESEANFRAFFNTVDDMIIVGAPDGKILYANPAITAKLGYGADELKNMHILDLHIARQRREAETIFTAMFRGEQDVCPLPLCSRTGVVIPVETRVWFGKWSSMDCIFGICKDLTREQEAIQKFNRLFNNTPAPTAVSNAQERRFTEVNEAFLHVLGYDRSEVIGKTSAELGLFVEQEKQQAIAEQLQAHGRIGHYELQIRCKDGTLRDGLFSGETIESQGKKYFLTVMTDLTEHKRAEEELKRHRGHLEDIVKERTEELESKNMTLAELNTALKVLLKQRDDDKKDMEERFEMNVRNLVLPYVEQMKKYQLEARQRSFLNIIETHLNEITTPLLKNIRQLNLTPKEIKVAMLVRQGRSTKEIADILGIASGSIDVHRKNIRKKLGVHQRKTNLQSYLEGLTE